MCICCTLMMTGVFWEHKKRWKKKCYWNEVGLGTHTTQMKICVPLKVTMLKKLI